MDTLDTYAARYGFRVRHAWEPEGAYRAALIAHVEHRDFAAAHELRLDKPQAQWTSAEAAAFRAHLERLPRASQTLRGDLALPMLVGGEPLPVTDESVLAMGRRGMDGISALRENDPARELAIVACVLLFDGSTLYTSVPRGDRIGILKALAQDAPVFGFMIAADVFMHGFTIDPATNVHRSYKHDALLVHVGTRTLRRSLVRKYTVTRGVAIFEDTEEISGTEITDDPYAEIFVSVPPPSGVPS